MKKEEKEIIYETLKKNPSFKPIADLLLLVENTRKMAVEAEIIGDRLSAFAAKGEAGREVVPAMGPWMVLCDFYKEGARDFALSLKKAARDSRIQQLPEQLRQYNNDTFEGLRFMLENDPDFRDMWREVTDENDEDDDD